MNSSPCPQFNVVYREVVIACLQRCWGERELPTLVMQLGIIPKLPCQRIFVQSDPGVPRTFVVDCRSAWTPKSCVLISGGLLYYI